MPFQAANIQKNQKSRNFLSFCRYLCGFALSETALRLYGVICTASAISISERCNYLSYFFYFCGKIEKRLNYDRPNYRFQ